MHFESETLYHIYNQGNNQETIFLEKADYVVFLYKIKERIAPFCQIINYCLMPNHYHFIINATEESSELIKLGGININKLTNGFRLLNSLYANQFNEKYKRSGSLFRQKTKAKSLEYSHKDYPFICFNYVHQNPIKAGLCEKMEDWEFSSFRDYWGVRNGKLINKEFAFELIDISENKEIFYEDSYCNILDDDIKELYL
ncbi:transposase [Bernardetia sp. ABR2-2B]|uniref:transposase n=1 Tax=Bernardetia sp. ABR2-2B TaxID=3127472 RepID=UPI0030D53386